jgi:putative protease
MQMEILAPVGSKESLVAAVNSGADAIYFGAKNFNARRNAENFDPNSLSETIAYCRQNGVKCYLTLNILIKDSEIDEALAVAKTAANLGIDGIIVQDLGLAYLIHKFLPDLPLHGSTQLSVHSASALKLLKDLGFCRIVPAREMSKEQLKVFCNTAKSLNMEVEVFVHGALCMSVSGQCYFSAHLGGRSANRGLCAGTCRLPFCAEKGTGYDLSLKDLSLINEIQSLKKLGVSSLKIEGRMKRAEYVASSVNCLKQAINSNCVNPKDYALLKDVFSRSGFTDGYFNNSLGRDMFGVRTEQDQLSTSNSLSKLHELYRRPIQRLPLTVYFSLLKGRNAKITVKYKDFEVTVTGEIPQKAINKPTTKEALEATLSKLGGTPYFLERFTSDIEQGLMLPISSINKMKSSAISALDEKRAILPKENNIDYIHPLCQRGKNIKGYFLRFANKNQLIPLSKKIVGYSLPAEELVNIPSIDELKKSTQTEFLPVAELPRGADDEEYIICLLNQLEALGIKTVVCSNLSTVSLAVLKGFEIFGGFGLNLYNCLSLKTAENLGIKKGVISPELSLEEQALLNYNNFESYAFCYGRFPLMLTKNCPVKNGVGCNGKDTYCKITDRKKEEFPVICRNGYSEILNSRPTNIADQVQKISADFGYLYFTLEEKPEIVSVIDGFDKGVISSARFTRGLSKNGVF